MSINSGLSPEGAHGDVNSSQDNKSPVIGLALSGGGSRAMAFHLGCLRALHELSVLDKIDVISTISGGSVLGAYYTFTPEKTFNQFEDHIRTVLLRGFQRDIAYEMLKPMTLASCIGSWIFSKGSEGVARLLGSSFNPPRLKTRTDVLETVFSKRLFSGLTMGSPRRNDIDIVIGACELRTGTAFRFGNDKSGGWRQGELDIGDVPVALAVTASAAYPVFLPCLERTWWFRKGSARSRQRVTLTDGGVYDNLGLQVLEPGRNAVFSLHTFPCDFLIVCNAGPGQDSGDEISTGFYPRVKRSIDVMHRRVQDSSMHRLHQLADSKLIKGFAMPYLGQIDERLPSTPDSFVKREVVVNYPTDFSAMSEAWIDRLSGRGEQLTKVLVSHYLSEIVN